MHTQIIINANMLISLIETPRVSIPPCNRHSLQPGCHITSQNSSWLNKSSNTDKLEKSAPSCFVIYLYQRVISRRNDSCMAISNEKIQKSRQRLKIKQAHLFSVKKSDTRARKLIALQQLLYSKRPRELRNCTLV